MASSDPLATFYQQYYPTAQDVQPYMPGPGYLEPAHQGVDIAGIPVGSPVQLPVGGTYQQSLSNPYMSVFKIANGTYEGILHITATAFPDQAPVGAGQPIGTVSSLVGWPVTFPGGATTIQDYNNGAISSYFSTEPHIHIDNYSDPVSASVAFGGGSSNPENLPIGSGVSSYPPGVSPLPNMNPGDIAGAIAGAIGSTTDNIQGAVNNATDNIISGFLDKIGFPKDLAGRSIAVIIGILLVFVGIAFIIRVNPIKVIGKVA